ncbi:MAG: hypothetical protein ACE5HS_19180 [bacterium]
MIKILATLTRIILLLLLVMTTSLFSQKNKNPELKTLPAAERRAIMKEFYKSFNAALQNDEIHEKQKFTTISGNEIKVLLTNMGSISTPDADITDADLFWPKGIGLGYAYEFGPLVAAEVPHAFIPDSMIHIVNDGFIQVADGDFRPGTAEKWGWLPKVGFSDPNSNEMATFNDLDEDRDGKPDSWPQRYFNETLGRYVWPAFLGDDATTPDEEVFYVMDDFNNAEFQYYPFPDDSTKRGLGLELQVRIFQFNNALAEDIIFLVYTITNVSPKKLDTIYLGMFGDPHVGGPNDFSDDNADFISAFNENFPFDTRNMLFASDNDNRGDGGRIPGVFGYRFLESPGINFDGQDNDNDGLIDESPFNDAGTEVFDGVGIYGPPKLHWSGDEDGDWDVEFDDLGVDGIPGTGDFGEGDGKPTQLYFLDLNGNAILDVGEPISETRLEGMRFHGGEPNFGFLDIAESDQLGLTSFNAIIFGGNNRPKNDELMWSLMSTPNQRPEDPAPEIEQQADNVFIYGSGPFSLEPGESQRFSIALILGVDINELLQNAEISQQVFESDYRFAQPPLKPNLVAVPDDGKVTLYWDTRAETSFDQFVARANPDEPKKGFDFEGYRIYRSRDFSFNDTKTITDGKGNPFLSVPYSQGGVPAQFDLINEFSGFSDIEYAGRGGIRYNLGTNTGLVHAYVDSNVTNGVTYFYAVTSYDHGDVKAEIAPSESQRSIDQDALTREFTFDINTALAVPGALAVGTVEPGLADTEGNFAIREIGNATGSVKVQFLDPFEVVDGKKYEVVFEEVELDNGSKQMTYSVIDLLPQTLSFVARDTIFVNLISCCDLVEGSVTVTDQAGVEVDPLRYQIDLESGKIRGVTQGDLPSGETFNITFLIKPVANSTSLNNEDDNAVFDGMRLFVRDEPIAVDPARSGFKIKNSNTNLRVIELGLARVGSPKPIDTDFEFHFAGYDTASDGSLTAPADSSIKLGAAPQVKAPFKIIDTATGDRVDFFIQENVLGLKNFRWDYQETVVIIRPNTRLETTYQIKFAPPSDTLKTADGSADSLVTFDDPIYPGDGDVFLVFSKKPFEEGDKYTFTTQAVSFDSKIAKNALDDVIVVPNPYVAFSKSELTFRQGIRNDRRVEFRNLPPECTIRIYTIAGELVDTIEKDDNLSFAVWDLLTFESQETAYGVYIYHVEAPGVGTKIGRLALIK